jgi:hypothetical protein
LYKEAILIFLDSSGPAFLGQLNKKAKSVAMSMVLIKEEYQVLTWEKDLHVNIR